MKPKQKHEKRNKVNINKHLARIRQDVNELSRHIDWLVEECVQEDM